MSRPSVACASARTLTVSIRSKLVPLLLVLLMAAGMFPCDSERKAALNLDYLVDHIVFGAKCGACKCRGSRKAGRDVFNETFVAGGDAEPGGRFGRILDWGRGVLLDPLVGDVGRQQTQAMIES